MVGEIASRSIEIMATAITENIDLLSDRAKRKKSNILYNETESEIEMMHTLNADGSLKFPCDITNVDCSNTFSQFFPGSAGWNEEIASACSKHFAKKYTGGCWP